MQDPSDVSGETERTTRVTSETVAHTHESIADIRVSIEKSLTAIDATRTLLSPARSWTYPVPARRHGIRGRITRGVHQVATHAIVGTQRQ